METGGIIMVTDSGDRLHPIGTIDTNRSNEPGIERLFAQTGDKASDQSSESKLRYSIETIRLRLYPVNEFSYFNV